MADNLFLEVQDNVEDELVWLKPINNDSIFAFFEHSEEHAEKAVTAYSKLIELSRSTMNNLYDICYYLNSFSVNSIYLRTQMLVRDREHTRMGDDEVVELVAKLGISQSSFYRYRDIGMFVDIDNHRLIPKLEGYNISQLCEIITYVRTIYGRDGDLKNGVLNTLEIIPSTSTIIQIQTFRNVMQLRNKNKTPFEWSSDPNSMYQKIQYDTKLEDVLKLWQEWEEGQANKQLEETMSGKSATNDPTPEFDETIRSLREEIRTLRLGYVAELGMCDGCKFNGVNLNKCRSCRRYRNMRDLYERA